MTEEEQIEHNKRVLQNFVLYIMVGKGRKVFTREELLKLVDWYIEEDHADGRDGAVTDDG